eukprot:CAMPEP_0173198774 /NCGR_PEP_ID=MMETSP1141-20130122/16871_1 /TAXON_ID=483371 /ORGANISM="non described non described, Strain CCMP2298" /LENGTH=73 /DNA_ID=CAMNT_0014123599 /DNA_START=847 /DNA_END=1065 /DNA_ORIENTATION=+
MHSNEFFNPINRGSWALTTTCAHSTQGQENPTTQLGTCSRHPKRDDDQAPVGIPITSKLDRGLSSVSSPPPPP